MNDIMPSDVFNIGYYWYQWLRRTHPEVLEQIRSTPQSLYFEEEENEEEGVGYGA